MTVAELIERLSVRGTDHELCSGGVIPTVTPPPFSSSPSRGRSNDCAAPALC